MQGDKVEERKEEEVGETQLYYAEESLSPLQVRAAGLLLFFIMTGAGILTGLFDVVGFSNVISDVRITLPLVVGSYLARFLLQYLSLLLFAGLGKRQLRVGFSEKNISPFVHAKRPFELKRFRIYQITPFVIMALLPLAYTMIWNNTSVYVIASYTFAFCINDVISFFRSYKYPPYLLAADHPQKFGFVLYDNPFYNNQI